MIVRKGLEATTLRDIAREGGFTTGVVSHYFPDKQAVIVGTLHLRGRGVDILVQRTVAAAPTRRSSASSTSSACRSRTDPVLPAEWRLWSEMWTYAERDPAFAEQLVETDAAWERFDPRRAGARRARPGLSAPISTSPPRPPCSRG